MPPTPQEFFKIFRFFLGYVFWFFGFLTSESAPGAPQIKSGTSFSISQQIFIKIRPILDNFMTNLRSKYKIFNFLKQYYNIVFEKFNTFRPFPGLGTSANHFPRSKY